MNDMTIPQTTPKAPETLEDVQNLLDHVVSSLTAIGQETAAIHQEIALLQGELDKELESEREFLSEQESTAKPRPEYKLTKADYAYIKRFGTSWFNTSVFTTLTGKSDGAMTGFIHRVRHAENSQWIVNCKKAGGRRKIYQILPKGDALHDAA